ncbi:MAG: DNA topoisomerase IB [Candidatus Binataceae bacterium]
MKASEIKSAEVARLVHLGDDGPGLTRKRRGRGFDYETASGKKLRDRATLARIEQLAIPPAWTEVWISPRADSHLQATGRDAKRRKQYIYHPDFRAIREQQKYEHVIEFARVLPAIRRTVTLHMARTGLSREKVLATIVHLLESTMIRIGNEDYARSNQSYGLTTLRNPHVDVAGKTLRFHFKGKSGKTWNLKIDNPRVARIVRACQELPGQHLFEYVDGDGAVRQVTSTDVNEYLREITGRDVTAKDFRTWSGTVLAALALTEIQAAATGAPTKKAIKDAIARVADRLGNTVSVCRKCYVHPQVIEAYSVGELVLKPRKSARGAARLSADEAAVLAFLQGRLKIRKGFARAA